MTDSTRPRWCILCNTTHGTSAAELRACAATDCSPSEAETGAIPEPWIGWVDELSTFTPLEAREILGSHRGWYGLSDPVSNFDIATSNGSVTSAMEEQAKHRALRQWASDPSAENWIPGNPEVSIERQQEDLFIADNAVIKFHFRAIRIMSVSEAVRANRLGVRVNFSLDEPGQRG